jgi:hypothetical protein
MNGQRLGGLSTYQFPCSHYSIIDTRKHETNLEVVRFLFYFILKKLVLEFIRESNK